MCWDQRKKSCRAKVMTYLVCWLKLICFCFFSTTPISPTPPPRPSSHIFSCVPFTPHHVLSLVSFLIPHIPLHPSAFPPLCRVPTCDFFLSRSSFSLLLYLFTSSPFPPAPSLSPPPSPLLWQASHCSESVSWRQAAGLPQRWGVQHWVYWEPQPHPAMTSWTGKRAAWGWHTPPGTHCPRRSPSEWRVCGREGPHLRALNSMLVCLYSENRYGEFVSICVCFGGEVGGWEGVCVCLLTYSKWAHLLLSVHACVSSSVPLLSLHVRQMHWQAVQFFSW